MIFGLLATCGLGACGGDPFTVAPGPPQPAIQMVLLAGADSQYASVLYTIPAAPSVELRTLPVAADSVHLELMLLGGIAQQLLPIAASPGRFVTALQVQVGGTYELRGTVSGTPIHAVTHVPGAMTLDQPASDTVRASTEPGADLIPFSARSAAAGGYLIVQSFIGDSGNMARQFIGTGGGQLALQPPRFDRPGTAIMTVQPFDSAATAFLFDGFTSEPAAGNIDGALGVFGSAGPALAATTIIWE